MQGEIVTCPKCGNEIGEIMEINGLSLLRINSLAIRNIDSICLHCGASFNWHYPDLMLRRIINRQNNKP